MRLWGLGFLGVLGLPILGIAQAQTLEGQALVAELQKGGYVIFFRHARTDSSQTDQDTRNLENCTTQRNLSEEGREQARAIGEAFRALRIPLEEVLSSPYCRTRETAQLAFGKAQSTLALLSPLADNSDREARVADLRKLLSTPPKPGSNTMLVAHQLNLSNATGVALAEGEAAIYRPDGKGGFSLVARVTSEAWQALTQGR